VKKEKQVTIYYLQDGRYHELTHSADYALSKKTTQNALIKKRNRGTLKDHHFFIKGGYYFVNRVTALTKKLEGEK